MSRCEKPFTFSDAACCFSENVLCECVGSISAVTSTGKEKRNSMNNKTFTLPVTSFGRECEVSASSTDSVEDLKKRVCDGLELEQDCFRLFSNGR